MEPKPENANSAGGLSARAIRKEYPGTVALDDVDFDVHPGEVVALLGENGAGKSTLASIIAGVTTPTSGTMTWNGQPFAPAGPREAMAAGIGMIHQELRLLPDLTIAENVLVGRWPMKNRRVDRSQMNATAEDLLGRLGFEGRVDRPIRELSVAGQQLVEIAKAISLESRLLILDEPTAALGREETEALFSVLKDLKKDGISFVYVSHRLEEIAVIADRIEVLRDGQHVQAFPTGAPERSELIEAMVGRSVDRLFPTIDPPRERVRLKVDSLSSAEDRFHDISFEVSAGEVFGIGGIVGAGRTELVRAIAGADKVSSGTTTVDGELVPSGDSRQAIRAGIVLVPEDRKLQGLIVDMSISDNIAMSNLDAVESTGGWVLPRRAAEFADRVKKAFGIKGQVANPASSLSGGNQQKVVIGKWLARDPKVVILDEPTRGIDVGARSGIYEVIRDLAQAGTAVIVVSSDLEEVLGMSHRVMVLSDGHSRGILDRAEATATSVMELATTTSTPASMPAQQLRVPA